MIILRQRPLSLHNDLHLQLAKDVAKTRYRKFHSFWRYHPNTLAQQLSSHTLPYNPWTVTEVASRPIRIVLYIYI